MKTKTKKTVCDYIEAQLEFDPKELGGDHFTDYEVRVYNGTPNDPKNVAMSVVISKKDKLKLSKDNKAKH